MLVGSVIDHQLGDDADLPSVGFGNESSRFFNRAIIRIDAGVVGDVVAIVLQRRRIKRQQPDRGDAEFFQVVEF